MNKELNDLFCFPFLMNFWWPMNNLAGFKRLKRITGTIQSSWRTQNVRLFLVISKCLILGPVLRSEPLNLLSRRLKCNVVAMQMAGLSERRYSCLTASESAGTCSRRSSIYSFKNKHVANYKLFLNNWNLSAKS